MEPSSDRPRRPGARLHGGIFWLLAALLLASAVRGASKALTERGNDLTIYLDAAASLLSGASPYEVTDYIYLPFFVSLLAPLELLPRGASVGLWQLGSWLATLWGVLAATRLVDPGGRRPWLAWVTLLATLRLWASNLAYGQANAFTFAAAIAALTMHWRGRDRAAGVVIGLATAFKVLPAVLLVLLAIRGRWRGVLAGVASVLTVSALLPALHVGPQGVVALHETWFERVASPFLQGGEALLEERPYVSGQSLLATAYRTFAATPVSASDLDARAALARWDPEVVHLFVRVAVFGHVALMVAALYRGRRLRRTDEVALAGALALCTAVLTGPLVHKAHMAWSALGFAVLIEHAVAGDRRSRIRVAAPLALAVLSIGLSAPLLVGSQLARDVLAHSGMFLGIESLWIGLLIEQWRGGARPFSARQSSVSPSELEARALGGRQNGSSGSRASLPVP